MSNRLHEAIAREVKTGASVLDVGAGMAEYHFWLVTHVEFLTLVDAHQPYLVEQQRRLADANNVRFILGEAPGALADLTSWTAVEIARVQPVSLQPPHFDVCLGIDFIEHLGLGAARLTIGLMKRLASKVVLFVPEGHHPQTNDHFKMGGDHWQTHRSEWHRDDLEALGFQVEVWSDFHASTDGKDPGAMFAVWCEGGGRSPTTSTNGFER